MENDKESFNCSNCPFYSVCSWAHGQHHWMHLVIKIAIAVFIFWCGMQFGELRAALHGNYGNYRMIGSYGEGRNAMYGGGPIMMNRGTSATVVSPTATTTPKK